MTLDQADSIFAAYQELIRDGDKRGARRSPALLPASKENIMRAIWMLVARLYYQGLDDPNSLKPLVEAAMFLDSFSHDPIDSLGFLQSMQERRNEVLGFHQQLSEIHRNEPFFWQRIYALLGITSQTKSSTFFDQLKERLGRAIRPKTA
jgi:hypothetical protein